MKFQGKLPPQNGLTVAARRLGEKQPVVALVVLRAKQRVEDFEKGETELVAKISQIEVVLPEDLLLVEDLMRRSLEFRTGTPVLPYDLEKAIRALFTTADLDPDPRDDDAQPELPLAGTPAMVCDHCGVELERNADGFWADELLGTHCTKNPDASVHEVGGDQ
jgi:hypothetical protein